VVALANDVRDLKAGEGEKAAAIALPTTGSSIALNVVSESLKIRDVMKMFQMHLKPVQVHRPGDANFPAARRCWTRVARSLTLVELFVECGSVTLLSLVLSIRVMLEILVETTA
jgi:hypothetical protein